MAKDLKISEMTPITLLGGQEIIPAVVGHTNHSITTQQILDETVGCIPALGDLTDLEIVDLTVRLNEMEKLIQELTDLIDKMAPSFNSDFNNDFKIK